MQTSHATYLTVSESRRWSLDNPVGNPYGGPAFKQKEMPVVALGAIAIGAMGFAGAITMSAFAAGMMMASGALSFVGQMTGNKTLTTIGAVVGLAGGAFELFGGAAMFSGGEAVAGTAATAETMAAGTEAVASAELAADASVASAAAAAPTAGAESVAGMAPAAEVGAGSIGVMDQIPQAGLVDNVANTAAAQPASTLPTGLNAGTAPAAESSFIGSVDDFYNKALGSGPNGAETISVGGTGSGTSWGDKAIGVFDKLNQGGGLINQVGNIAKAYGQSDLVDAQTGRLQSESELIAAKADTENELRAANKALLEAQAAGSAENTKLISAKIKELEWNLAEMERKRNNINTRATNSLAQNGAVNQGANLYNTSTATVPQSGFGTTAFKGA